MSTIDVSIADGEAADPAPSGPSSTGTAAPSRAAVPATPIVPLWLLALVTFSGTIAMHVFVPALPEAAKGLGVDSGAMALTISFYILGLGVGQLIYGPVADKYGRRPVLMFGITVFTLASIAAYFAPNLHLLNIARLLQALGGCSGIVLGRAIVRDGSAAGEATRRLALMNLMVTIGPGIAPMIGVVLVEVTGWRSIFLALTAMGIANLFLVIRLMPETGGGKGRSARVVARDYLRLMRSPAFLGFAIGGGCATTALYAYVSVAPFVFVHQLGRPSGEVGVYLALNVLGLWFGSLLVSRLVRLVTPMRIMVAGNIVSVCGAVAMLVLALVGELSVPGVVIPMMVFTFGAGLAAPAALTEAMSVNPLAAGSASGLYGAAQMVIGALCTSLAGLGSNPAVAAAVVLVVAGVLAQVAFHAARRFAGRSPVAGEVVVAPVTVK
ncbi:multidrug effflux MFS transporter [Acuticoccus sediminis]|uniref:multidrug effflux MFS transporter n=1 Tax=Acuticoccus sediminis TaxID=2184697 RepID=UPI001CFD9A5D|nr:multidrug effflux MFS transporter [Acuticoccus sediminis]